MFSEHCSATKKRFLWSKQFGSIILIQYIEHIENRRFFRNFYPGHLCAKRLSENGSQTSNMLDTSNRFTPTFLPATLAIISVSDSDWHSSRMISLGILLVRKQPQSTLFITNYQYTVLPTQRFNHPLTGKSKQFLLDYLDFFICDISLVSTFPPSDLFRS